MGGFFFVRHSALEGYFLFKCSASITTFLSQTHFCKEAELGDPSFIIGFFFKFSSLSFLNSHFRPLAAFCTSSAQEFIPSKIQPNSLFSMSNTRFLPRCEKDRIRISCPLSVCCFYSLSFGKLTYFRKLPGCRPSSSSSNR